MASVEFVEEISPIASAWDDLADRARSAPFLRPGWLTAWWGAFGGGGRPRILLVRRRSELVGILPLWERRGRLRSMTNDHTPEFDFLVADRAAVRLLSRALFSWEPRGLRLEYLGDDAGTVEECRAAGIAAGYSVDVRPWMRSPYIPITAEWSVFERRLSRNVRHDVERRLRRLREQGDVRLEIAEGSELLEQLLDEGFRVEASGWKGVHGTAIASRPATSRFYREVAWWAAERGWLRLAFLRLDGRPLAFQFDLEANRRYYSLKTGYDPAYEFFSPGKILAHMMVKRAVSERLLSYEFLGRDEPWKARWTEAVRERRLLQAFAPGVTGALEAMAYRYGRPVVGGWRPGRAREPLGR